MLDQNKIIITAGVSILLWVATLWVRMIRNFLQKRSEHRNLVRSLYAEVDFNTKDLLFFKEKSVSLTKLEKEFTKNPKLIPHITDAHHTLIYTSNVQNLHYINNRLVTRLVLFYGLLDKIKEQIDGLNQPSYASISARGKHKVLISLFENVVEAETIGSDILDNFVKEYANLNLSRQFRLRND